MINVGIVGSEEKYWTESQKGLVYEKILEILGSYDYPILISGGCPNGGVDIWAEEVASDLKIERVIHYPEVQRWNSVATFDGRVLRGYKTRNIEIAEQSDVLYDIEPEFVDHDVTKFGDKVEYDWNTGKYYRRSGGTWTMRHAQNHLHKETYLVIIPYVDQ